MTCYDSLTWDSDSIMVVEVDRHVDMYIIPQKFILMLHNQEKRTVQKNVCTCVPHAIDKRYQGPG